MILFDRVLLKVLLVGAVNTAIGAGLMFVLYNIFGAGYWVSSAANYVVGSIVSFLLNKYFTFNVRRWSLAMIAAFVLTIAVSYVIAYGISKPAVNYLLKDSPQKIRENIALFTGMCLFTAINYLGQRYVVFRKR